MPPRTSLLKEPSRTSRKSHSNRKGNKANVASQYAENDEECSYCDTHCTCNASNLRGSEAISSSPSRRSNRRNRMASRGPKHDDAYEAQDFSDSSVYYSPMEDFESEAEEMGGIASRVHKRAARVRSANRNDGVLSEDYSSSENLSDNEGMSTSSSVKDLMLSEEQLICEEGMNSDEERLNNAADVTDEFNALLKTDPNEIDHLWTSEEEIMALLNDTSSSSASSAESEQKNPTVTGHGNSKKSKVCRRKRTNKRSNENSEHCVSNLNPLLTPEIIQAYLASRGIIVSHSHAVQLAVNVSSGLPSPINSPSVERKTARSHTATNNSVVNTKQTSKLSALASIAAKESDLKATLFNDARNIDILRGQNLDNISRRVTKSSVYTFNGSTMGVKEELTIESLVEIDMKDDSRSSNIASSFIKNVHDVPEDVRRWQKIPIGTFMRSRKNSTPVLKLSKAVKNTFGVVPKSIHETLATGKAKYEVLKKMDVHVSNADKSAYRHLYHDDEDDHCSCSECEDNAVYSVTNVESHGISKRSNSSMDEERRMYKRVLESEIAKSDNRKRKRKISMNFNDLSLIIQDVNQPPSNCASPSSLFISSPNLSAMPVHFDFDEFDLGPSA